MPFGVLDLAPLLMWGALAGLIVKGLRPLWAALAVTLVCGVIWAALETPGVDLFSGDALNRIVEPITQSQWLLNVLRVLQNDTLPASCIYLLTLILMAQSRETHRLMDAVNTLLQRGWSWVLVVAVVLGLELWVYGTEGLLGDILVGVSLLFGWILAPYWLIELSARNRNFRYYVACAVVLWSAWATLPLVLHKTVWLALGLLCVYGALRERRLQQALANQTTHYPPGPGFFFMALCLLLGIASAQGLIAYRVSQSDLPTPAWPVDERVVLMGVFTVVVAMLLSALDLWGPKAFLAPAAQQVGRASFTIAPVYFSLATILIGVATPSEGAFLCWVWVVVFVACRRRLGWALVWASLRQCVHVVLLFFVMAWGFNVVLNAFLQRSDWGAELLNPGCCTTWSAPHRQTPILPRNSVLDSVLCA